MYFQDCLDQKYMNTLKHIHKQPLKVAVTVEFKQIKKVRSSQLETAATVVKILKKRQFKEFIF